MSGLNQTLKQRVVFTGNLLAVSDAKKIPQQAPGGGSNFSLSGGNGGNQKQPALNQQQMSLLNSRIAGTAVIANTNTIEINAEPQAQ